jgi:hypothetical protein
MRRWHLLEVSASQLVAAWEAWQRSDETRLQLKKLCIVTEGGLTSRYFRASHILREISPSLQTAKSRLPAYYQVVLAPTKINTPALVPSFLLPPPEYSIHAPARPKEAGTTPITN